MIDSLDVCEVYRSIQGEGLHVGLPCVLVRLAGCNLRCRWCDTPYAQQSAESTLMTVDEIVHMVAGLGGPLVEVTGGEPLTQSASVALIRRLCDEGFDVLLETNGSMDVSTIDPRVTKIVDVKCPASGHAGDNRWSNLRHLSGDDQLKFVIAEEGDFDFARDVLRQYALPGPFYVYFTAAAGQLDPALLARWILADASLPTNVRLGLQMHKILWPNVTRGA
jgi:7-carboxy-7-deazaguanine synthase